MNDGDTKMSISNSGITIPKRLIIFHSFQFNSTSLWKTAGLLITHPCLENNPFVLSKA